MTDDRPENPDDVMARAFAPPPDQSTLQARLLHMADLLEAKLRSAGMFDGPDGREVFDLREAATRAAHYDSVVSAWDAPGSARPAGASSSGRRFGSSGSARSGWAASGWARSSWLVATTVSRPPAAAGLAGSSARLRGRSKPSRSGSRGPVAIHQRRHDHGRQTHRRGSR